MGIEVRRVREAVVSEVRTVQDLVAVLQEFDPAAPLLPWHVGAAECGDLGRLALERVYEGRRGHVNLLFRAEPDE